MWLSNSLGKQEEKIILTELSNLLKAEKEPSRGVLRKRCLVLLCKFIEIALRHGCSPVHLLHIFRTTLPRNEKFLYIRIIISQDIQPTISILAPPNLYKYYICSKVNKSYKSV